jgi:serine/threonine protein kinase
MKAMSCVCPSCHISFSGSACPDCGWLAASNATAQPLPAARAAGNGTHVRDLRCDACRSQSRPGSLVCERCASALPLAAGTVLNGGKQRYRLEKHLKSGGFGAVYKATRQSDGATVAVKEMICTDPAGRAIRYEFFRRESRILQEAQAFRIVPEFHDFFDVGNDAFLVLEFVQGEDLLRRMTHLGQPYAPTQVVGWAIQICDVLQWMHTQQPPMVHRDLKPDNIMLVGAGPGIKMIDFGAVRATGKRPATSNPMPTGIVYAEGYSPLEQIAGKAEPRSDLFALSATMYHLLTMEHPSDVAPARNRLPASCPKWLAELIFINLAEDRMDRYLSVADFKQDLVDAKVTTTVVCGHCQRSSPARTPYCAHCAGALTASVVRCPQCNQINVSGSRYCIHDGSLL